MSVRVRTLREIEESYDTQAIKWSGQCIWPLFRIKFNEELRTKNGITARTIKVGRQDVRKLFKTLFYGIRQLLFLPKYQYWVFSSSDRRKMIEGKYEDRVIEPISLGLDKALVIENPYPLGKHYARKDLNNVRIVSQTPFFLGIKLFSLFVRTPKVSEGDHELKKILKENGVQLDCQKIIKNHKAQYKFAKFLLGITRPKAVFFVYSASSMGYIKALREMKIPTIEIQHGIVNDKHYAYNLYKDFGKMFFPEYLFTFGNLEKRLFHEVNFFIKRENVFPVGYYFLERVLKNREFEDFSRIRKGDFKKVVVISLQDPFEDVYTDFINKVSLLEDSFLFVLVPRNPERSYKKLVKRNNVIVERSKSIYDCLKLADYHMTINSTTAIESLRFGVPNILYNYKEWAKQYYKDILDKTGHTVYVDTPQALIYAIRGNDFWDKTSIMEYSNVLFVPGFENNVLEVLRKHVLSNE